MLNHMWNRILKKCRILPDRDETTTISLAFEPEAVISVF